MKDENLLIGETLGDLIPRMADSHRAVLMNMFGLGFLDSVMLTADLLSLVVVVSESC